MTDVRQAWHVYSHVLPVLPRLLLDRIGVIPACPSVSNSVKQGSPNCHRVIYHQFGSFDLETGKSQLNRCFKSIQTIVAQNASYFGYCSCTRKHCPRFNRSSILIETRILFPVYSFIGRMEKLSEANQQREGFPISQALELSRGPQLLPIKHSLVGSDQIIRANGCSYLFSLNCPCTNLPK